MSCNIPVTLDVTEILPRLSIAALSLISLFNTVVASGSSTALIYVNNFCPSMILSPAFICCNTTSVLSSKASTLTTISDAISFARVSDIVAESSKPSSVYIIAILESLPIL